MTRWILLLLAFLLVLRLVMRFVFGLLQGLGAGPTSPRGGRPDPDAQGLGRVVGVGVRDPVCGTYLTRDSAVTARVGGETRYYCSDACRDTDRAASGDRPVGRSAHG